MAGKSGNSHTYSSIMTAEGDDQQSDVEYTSSGDATSDNSKGGRQEKINKLVSEGAKNYPAYLKLIYTGESELSSDDECDKPRRHQQRHQRDQVSIRPTETRTLDLAAILSPAESNKLLDVGRETDTSPQWNAGSEVYDLTPTCEVRGANGVHNDVTTPKCDVTGANDADQVEQWQLELLKIEDDISTLRGMLNAKLEIAADLKRKLGITAFVELKQSVRHFKLHRETIQKTNAVFKNLGNFATKKMANFRQHTSTASKPAAPVTAADADSSSIILQNQSCNGIQLTASKSDTNVTDFSRRRGFRR